MSNQRDIAELMAALKAFATECRDHTPLSNYLDETALRTDLRLMGFDELASLLYDDRYDAVLARIASYEATMVAKP